MENNFAPFYIGQKVVSVDAMPGSGFKNGQSYIVSSVEYKLGNQHHPIGRVTHYWYVGIVGWHDGGAYYRPSIFAPVIEIPLMTFTEIKELETLEILIAN